jgi:HEAT repeat protein
MAELPDELRAALEADDAEDLSRLLRDRRPEVVEGLRSLLTLDPSVPPDHRTKALHALGMLDDRAVVPTIIRILPQLDERGRISALHALGRLDTPEAIAAVIDHADEPSPQVRKAALLALSRNPTPEARRKLQDIAASDPVDWVREAARRHVR